VAFAWCSFNNKRLADLIDKGKFLLTSQRVF
jgi:hypothetical protein